jgi:hypothetical protein
MCTYRTYSMLLKILSSVSTGFAEQIMTILYILCYNGSLVTWTVVSLTTTKFKHLIFSMSGFTLFCTANMYVLMIPYEFCLKWISKSKSHCDWRSVSQLVLVSNPSARYLLLSDSYGLVFVGLDWQQMMSVNGIAQFCSLYRLRNQIE